MTKDSKNAHISDSASGGKGESMASEIRKGHSMENFESLELQRRQFISRAVTDESKCLDCGFAESLEEHHERDCDHYHQFRRKPTIAELEAILNDPSYKVVVNPDGSIRAEKMALIPEKVVVAVREFLEDWIKGDFALPTLASIDAEAIQVAWSDGTTPVEVGKTIATEFPAESYTEAASSGVGTVVESQTADEKGLASRVEELEWILSRQGICAECGARFIVHKFKDGTMVKCEGRSK